MGSHQRLQALLSGREVDRVPCHPFLNDHAARVLGVSLAQYHLDPTAMADAQIAAYREYGHDLITVGPALGLLECLGATLDYPQNAAPCLIAPSVDSPSDLRRLSPVNPRDPRIARYLDAAESIAHRVGEDVPVALTLRCPFSTAAQLRGVERFLEDLAMRPSFAHALLEIALRATLRIVDSARAIDGISFVATDPFASALSPQNYAAFAQPYAKRMIALMNVVGRYPTILHICGDTSNIWHAMAETKAGVLSLGHSVDFAQAAQTVGKRVVLMGNMQPTGSVRFGTPDRVREDALQCLWQGESCGGSVMLSLGCDLPVDAPPENVHALLDVAREHAHEH
jgi:uroporphyrinogen decarboxylase